MKYYLKTMLVPFIYLLFTAVANVGFMGSEKIPKGLSLALVILMLVVYLCILWSFNFKHGEQAYKDLIFNDRERKIIIETGEDRPLKIHEEYKAWKGFFLGFLVCIPLIVLMIIHTVFVVLGSSYVGFGYVAGLLYNVVFAIFEWILPSIGSLDYYLSLIAIPIICLTTGIAYLIGARKEIKIRRKIEQQKEFLHGNKK